MRETSQVPVIYNPTASRIQGRSKWQTGYVFQGKWSHRLLLGMLTGAVLGRGLLAYLSDVAQPAVAGATSETSCRSILQPTPIRLRYLEQVCNRLVELAGGEP